MSIEQPHILVVDDNPATLYSTSRVLRGAGWTVSEAASGEEALARVKNEVDLIILDINLPDIDGFEVCRQIRSNPVTAHLPVVHLSATFVNDVHKVHGLEGGADGYLTHPVEPPVLIATVKAFLRARQAENDAVINQARFKAIFENVITGVCMLSDGMTFKDVNPALCKILGSNRELLLGKKLFDLIPGSEHKNAEVTINNEIATRGSWRGQFPLLNSAGEAVDFEWSISVDTSLGMRLAIASDISERLKYEREREELLISERASRTEAERANRLKDEFLATLSHELRNPLNAMVGWTQLLRLQKATPEDLEQGLASIERNALLQAQMINDLLDISRITSGKIHLGLELTDPNLIIEQAIGNVAELARSKEIRIHKDLEFPVTKIMADPLRLQQIIWNLINNAVKFTLNGGEVRLSSRRQGSNIKIEIQDSGIGITESFLPHIFDRFRQGDASSTRAQGGLGLGLAIVKQLVEAHGGNISVASAGQNKGSVFTVLLPISNASHASDKKKPTESNSLIATKGTLADLSATRVLIVEDDADSRELLKKVLSTAGAVVAATHTVDDALDELQTFKPQIVLSDLGLPIRDGYDLIKEIRQRGHSNSQLPAIALTAFVREEDKARVLKNGFQGFLCKPFDAHELISLIQKFVKK